MTMNSDQGERVLAQRLIRRLENDGLATVLNGRVVWMADSEVELRLVLDREGLQEIADLAASDEETRCYRRALEHIREHEGKVCDEYEVCTHRACQSSYGAWAIADGALGSTDSRASDEERPS